MLWNEGNILSLTDFFLRKLILYRKCYLLNFIICLVDCYQKYIELIVVENVVEWGKYFESDWLASCRSGSLILPFPPMAFSPISKLFSPFYHLFYIFCFALYILAEEATGKMKLPCCRPSLEPSSLFWNFVNKKEGRRIDTMKN